MDVRHTAPNLGLVYMVNGSKGTVAIHPFVILLDVWVWTLTFSKRALSVSKKPVSWEN